MPRFTISFNIISSAGSAGLSNRRCRHLHLFVDNSFDALYVSLITGRLATFCSRLLRLVADFFIGLS